MDVFTNEQSNFDQSGTDTSNIVDIGLAREIHLIVIF
jgi:hypothetical protein